MDIESKNYDLNNLLKERELVKKNDLRQQDKVKKKFKEKEEILI